jgi:hypothetical protein
MPSHVLRQACSWISKSSSEYNEKRLKIISSIQFPLHMFPRRRRQISRPIRSPRPLKVKPILRQDNSLHKNNVALIFLLVIDKRCNRDGSRLAKEKNMIYYYLTCFIMTNNTIK